MSTYKPCPFCGGEAEFKEDETEFEYDARVACLICGCSLWITLGAYNLRSSWANMTEDERNEIKLSVYKKGIELWNQRA